MLWSRLRSIRRVANGRREAVDVGGMITARQERARGKTRPSHPRKFAD